MAEGSSVIHKQIITNQALTGTFQSAAYEVQRQSVINMQIIWTGTSPVGTADMQGSNDGLTWSNIGSATLAVSGNSGSGFLQPAQILIAHRYVRFQYTFTSGTGTGNVFLAAKEA